MDQRHDGNHGTRSQETSQRACVNCFRGIRKWLARRRPVRAIRHGIQRVRSWMQRHIRPHENEAAPEPAPEHGESNEAETSTTTTEEPLTLDNFTFYHELGRGGYGKVMLATIKNTEEKAAIKIIKKRKIIRMPSLVMTEQRVLRMANACPFLSRADAAFQTEDHLFFVLQYAEGGTLAQYIKSRGRLDIATTRFFAAELVCGIKFLHSNGIVHRDLKPCNILLDSAGHVMIADFGMSLDNVFGNSIIRDSYAGTRGFMAPETIAREGYNSSVDWWAFAVIVYTMATGRSPFPPELGHACELAHTPHYPEGLGRPLINLLQKLLCKSPILRMTIASYIRSHEFFQPIDWEKLQARELPPPFKLTSVEETLEGGTQNPISPQKQRTPISLEKQQFFEGFSFVSDEYKTKLTQLAAMNGAEDGELSASHQDHQAAGDRKDNVGGSEGKQMTAAASCIDHHSLPIYLPEARREEGNEHGGKPKTY